MAVMGRPTKYRPEYCDQIIKFFDREPVERFEVIKYNKAGQEYSVTEERACQCPTFEKFSADVGVSRQTLLAWTKDFPDFLVAYTNARALQANIMLVNGMSGLYNAGFTGLSMKNMHGWADKQEVENTHTVNQMPHVQIGGEAMIFDVGDDNVQISQDDD